MSSNQSGSRLYGISHKIIPFIQELLFDQPIQGVPTDEVKQKRDHALTYSPTHSLIMYVIGSAVIIDITCYLSRN